MAVIAFAMSTTSIFAQTIENPSFENGTKGWTVDGMVTQTNAEFTKKAGTVYVEKWVSKGNAVGNASVSQVLRNVPKGKYRLTVGAQNLNQNSLTQKCAGAWIYAGNQQTPVYTAADYSVEFTSLIGEVEVGFRAEGAKGNWLAVDNFRIQKIGDVDGADVVAEIQRVVTEAIALQPNMMSGKAAEALANAITEGNAITETSADAAVQTAYKNLTAAIDAAVASIAEYKALADALNAVKGAYDETKQGAADFKAELDKATEMVSNPDATSAELAAEVVALDRASLAFNLANATPGSGTAPSVTETNHYVVTGATEALMRAKMTGSNILERGVCWSTDHNPTVLDDRTTKSFSLNGTIFHVKGLKTGTVYYLRPYVMNKTYTVAYGDEVKIVTHGKGTCVGTWDEGAPDEAANTRCRNAIRETIEYFNQWTGIKGFTLSGHYGAQTPTADCSYGGWMRIGPNAGNQAIGTVIHETGHGVGVGTQARWSDKNVHDWRWLGREANDVYHFLENQYNDPEYVMVGDGTHGWGAKASYDWFVNGADKDKHQELQYIGGCALLYGLFVDGLCPTSGYPNGLPGYTYNYDDTKKYYIMGKDTKKGLGEGLMYEHSATAARWKPFLNGEEVGDEAAWYIEYQPTVGYYCFRNAKSGRYLSHTSGTSMQMKTLAAPSSNERFQLMPDRTDVTVEKEGNKITTHGYWFTWNASGNKAMEAGNYTETMKYGTAKVADFNYSSDAANQHWIIISEDELPLWNPSNVTLGDANGDGNVDVMDIVAIADYILNGTGDINLKAADYNKDNNIDVLDIVAISEKILNP